LKRTETGAGPLRRPRFLMIAALGLSTIACGPSGPGMSQVSGKVTYQGKPVPSGLITFVPAASGGRNATGQIGADGTYRLQTENPGDGALMGDYNVTIFAQDNPVLDYIPSKPVPPKYLAPAKYEKPATSGLKSTVQRGSNTFDFDLKD